MAPLSGVCTEQKGLKKGTEYQLIGLKFTPATDVNGEWKLKLGDDKAELTLKEAKKEIAGKMTGKIAGEVTKASAKGGRLTLTVKPGEKSSKLEADVKGDTLEGTIENADGKTTKFTAQRERKWGEPIKLFDGKSLDGWETMNPPGETADNHWTVVEGVMTNIKGGKNIRTKATFKNFKLHVEFRVPPKGNSGVYLRGRYEIQVHDDAGQKAEAHSAARSIVESLLQSTPPNPPTNGRPTTSRSSIST